MLLYKQTVVITKAYQPKIFGGNKVLPKFCDVCLNHDFLVLYGYKKKFCLKFWVKTKKRKVFTLICLRFLNSCPKNIVISKKKVFHLNLNFFLHIVFVFVVQKICFNEIIPCRCPKISNFIHIFLSLPKKLP